MDAARSELQQMTLSDHPGCESVYYEASIRKALILEGGAAAQPTAAAGAGGGAGQPHSTHALGSTTNGLPQMDPVRRAPYVRKFMGFVSPGGADAGAGQRGGGCGDTGAVSNNSPAVQSAAFKKEIIQAACSVCGEPVRLFQDMAMVKPSGGREKPWHQDHACECRLVTGLCMPWAGLSASFVLGVLECRPFRLRKAQSSHHSLLLPFSPLAIRHA